MVKFIDAKNFLFSKLEVEEALNQKKVFAQVSQFLGQMLFAYQENRGVENMDVVFFHKLNSHLRKELVD